MRKRILYLLLVAGLATACAVQEETESLNPAERTVLFRAEMPASETRTAFEPGENGLYPTRWTDRDTAVSVSLNYGAPKAAKVVPAADYRSAQFEYTTGAQADAYRFLIVTPGSAVETMSLSRTAWQIRIPAVQTPTRNSPDEAAQILAATTGALETIPTQLDVRFNHVTSYGRLTLLNLPSDLTVSAVTLSCTTPLAGSWYYSDGSLTPCEASSTLVLQTSETENVWFACAPGDVSGATLKVIVSTDKGTYEKQVTLHESRSFKPGRVASFSVDFSGIQPSASGEIYTLVTDASTLAAGDEILLLNAEGTYAIGSQKSNNRSAVAITVQNRQIESVGSTVQHFTLGGKAGAWNFLTHPGGQYLYTKEGSKNYLLTTTGTSPQDLSNWSISIASDGTATIAATYKDGSEKRIMKYNHTSSSNLLFATYRSSATVNQTSLMSIYRKTVLNGNIYDDDPVLDKTEYGAYLNGTERLFVAGSDQISREYNGNNLTFAILSPAAASVLEMDDIPTNPLVGDGFTLICREIRGAVIEERHFLVKVLRVDGSRVWLSDGNGNGFIIKK